MSKVNLETFEGGALQEKFDDAMKNIKEYLQFELGEMPQFTVIS